MSVQAARSHTRNARRITSLAGASARNRLTGIITDVQVDGVMAQIEIAAGRYRLVSLMTREAVDELGLRPGIRAAAAVQATSVIVELDTDPRLSGDWPAVTRAPKVRRKATTLISDDTRL